MLVAKSTMQEELTAWHPAHPELGFEEIVRRLCRAEA